MRVVGEASDGLEAVGVVARLRPRLVLMDIQMPVLDGLEAARRILQASRATSVLMLTTFDDDEYIYRALQCGASGFLLKDSPQSQLIGAVRAVAAGGALIDPLTTRRLIGRFTSAVRPARAVPPILGELTGRELDVLRLVAEGLSNAEIAERLVVEESTVKTHMGPHPDQAEPAGPGAGSRPGLRDRVRPGRALIRAGRSYLRRAGQALPAVRVP
jgi:DNA-binding NarL/FixJ family response regulator